MLLQGEHISLRALEPEDIDVLYAWENDTMLWEVSNTKTPFSKHLLKQYLDVAHLDIYTTKQQRMVIQEGREPIGLIDIFDFEPYHLRAGVGIYINKNYQNRNYGFEALGILKEYATQILGLHQLYATIDVENKKSLALFQKQGFKIVATKKDWIKTFDGWKDEVFLQCLL